MAVLPRCTAVRCERTTRSVRPADVPPLPAWRGSRRDLREGERARSALDNVIDVPPPLPPPKRPLPRSLPRSLPRPTATIHLQKDALRPRRASSGAESRATRTAKACEPTSIATASSASSSRHRTQTRTNKRTDDARQEGRSAKRRRTNRRMRWSVDSDRKHTAELGNETIGRARVRARLRKAEPLSLLVMDDQGRRDRRDEAVPSRQRRDCHRTDHPPAERKTSAWTFGSRFAAESHRMGTVCRRR